jgi:5-methylcytosine-specific restriction enzyme A
MPTRLCLSTGCPHPATHRGRCPTHARQNNQATHHNRHIYGSKRWQILRRSILFNHPLCPCGQIATDVDHITPIAKGGDPWTPANLQALCAPCHGQKTRAEQTT